MLIDKGHIRLTVDGVSLNIRVNDFNLDLNEIKVKNNSKMLVKYTFQIFRLI